MCISNSDLVFSTVGALVVITGVWSVSSLSINNQSLAVSAVFKQFMWRCFLHLRWYCSLDWYDSVVCNHKNSYYQLFWKFVDFCISICFRICICIPVASLRGAKHGNDFLANISPAMSLSQTSINFPILHILRHRLYHPKYSKEMKMYFAWKMDIFCNDQSHRLF